MKTMAILTDVSKCIGCEDCVAACQRTNQTGTDAPYRWQESPNDLSSNRWTTLAEAPNGRWARVHCRHCEEPGCAAACPVGALKKSPEGPVTYDPVICMGCRYCMMACPFRMTRYEWESPMPRVRKCILCYDKIKSGELLEPACTTACPTKATIYGDRDELLIEAKRRIKAEPEKYIDHIWGEEEVGGTTVLYISDVPLEKAGWPNTLGENARPVLAGKVLHTVPYTFAGVAVAMAGIQWTFKRRQDVAAAEADTEIVETLSAHGSNDHESGSEE
jgi:formate dehydrogenase iron-sulfur subunit